MKIRWRYEEDEWVFKGNKITDKENLDKIKNILENEGPIIVEHWFYRGSSAPNRKIFDDYNEFMNYLEDETFAGDAIDIWNYSKLCKPDSRIMYCKCPDDKGYIPRKGSY